MNALIKEGEDVHNYNVATLEPYVDKEGNIQKAIAYETRHTELAIWYDYDEVVKFYKYWTIPESPRWANTKIWKPSAVLDPSKGKFEKRDNFTRDPKGRKRRNHRPSFMWTELWRKMKRRRRRR